MAEASSHRLSALFSPRSIAVLGASNRPGRPGHQVLEALRRFDPDLPVYPVTPSYEEILGLPCVPTIDDLPDIDLAIIAGAPDRIESEVAQAIEHGVRALMVFGAPKSGPERDAWVKRIAHLANSAGVPLLGPDSLGFVNYTARCGATWAVPDKVATGGISIISQSGTVFWEAITNDPRLHFSFSCHSGLESTVTLSDLIEYSVSLDQTRAIGIYVETVRDTEGLASALDAAAEKGIPVVAINAGRTQASRAQMLTHAGRMAGDQSALESLFRRYGVARTVTPDEWWTTLSLLGGPRRMASGGIAAVMDSGGGLAMFLDYASDLGVPIAQVSEATQARLREILGFDGDLGGALDFWVGDADRHARTENLLTALAADEDTAAVMAFTTYAEASSAGFAHNIADACTSVAAITDKPVLAATYTSRQLYPDLMFELAQREIPILDGMHSSLQAVRHAFDHRQFLADRASDPGTEALAADTAAAWRDAVLHRTQLDEADALALLEMAGVPCVRTVRADSSQSVREAAAAVGYPVVLKTDEGIAHKAERGGVRLGIADDATLASAYDEMSASLGGRVIIAPMASGVEIAIGVVTGEFGPTVLVGAGGSLIELLSDRCALLAPVSSQQVATAMERLQVTRVLRARMGVNSAEEAQLHDIVSRVSILAAELTDVIAELDINPVMVGARGCLAVDALVGVRVPNVPSGMEPE